MSQEVPKTTKQWNVAGLGSFDELKLTEQPVPKCGDSQVVVKLHAASLNYRDLVIPMGKYPFAIQDNVIPGSDGAGTVLAVGKDVLRFKPGDKVVTVFHQHYIGGAMQPEHASHSLGGSTDGVLRSVGVFHENGLVQMPSTLNFREASTLSCAGLTAWNALFGLSDRKLAPGQWVLTQGTGGVSIFGIQFAKAAGAKVIATTSSNEKAKLLEQLGADHIINYRENEEWGSKAKELTGGLGVDHVIEVAGPKSMKQSLAAIRREGVISIIGFVGGFTQDQPGFLDCLNTGCIARGIFVGSRSQMEDMNRAIDANPSLKPIVDPKSWKLDELKEAYEYMWAGKHQSKIVIDIE